MLIEIYSDIACPWCYIGERRLSRALEGFGEAPVEVVFRPFQLDPSMPDAPVPMREYLARRFGADHDGLQRHVAAIAAGEGIRMDFESGVIVNTFTAHRLLRLAEREHGPAVQRDLAERLFAAHFEHGRNVADPRVLSDLAAAAGMDAERVSAYLASGEGAPETREELEGARRLGVQAVPTFIIAGRYAVQGAQDPETLRQVLARAAAQGAG